MGFLCLSVDCLFVCSRVGRQRPALATHPGRPTPGDPPWATHPGRPTRCDPPFVTHPSRSYRPLAGVRYIYLFIFDREFQLQPCATLPCTVQIGHSMHASQVTHCYGGFRSHCIIGRTAVSLLERTNKISGAYNSSSRNGDPCTLRKLAWTCAD